MSKLDFQLNRASGIINMVLATAVIFVITTMRSPEVTALFVYGGYVVFGSMFMYGLNKTLNATHSLAYLEQTGSDK